MINNFARRMLTVLPFINSILNTSREVNARPSAHRAPIYHFLLPSKKNARIRLHSKNIQKKGVKLV